MTEAEDRTPLQSKCKATTALLHYAVWRERGGKSETFDTIIHAARASGIPKFTWHHTNESVRMLLSMASPRAIILASPHFLRDRLWREAHFQKWAAAVSMTPYSEDLAQSVVDILLEFASGVQLSQHITVDIWTWLTKRLLSHPFVRDVMPEPTLASSRLSRRSKTSRFSSPTSFSSGQSGMTCCPTTLTLHGIPHRPSSMTPHWTAPSPTVHRAPARPTPPGLCSAVSA